LNTGRWATDGLNRFVRCARRSKPAGVEAGGCHRKKAPVTVSYFRPTLDPGQRDALIRIAAYGLSNWFVRMGPAIVDRSMTESLNGKTVSIPDATTDERVEYRKQVRQEGIVSILSVPVKLRGERNWTTTSVSAQTVAEFGLLLVVRSPVTTKNMHGESPPNQL
jgi:hypothetical protein